MVNRAATRNNLVDPAKSRFAFQIKTPVFYPAINTWEQIPFTYFSQFSSGDVLPLEQYTQGKFLAGSLYKGGVQITHNTGISLIYRLVWQIRLRGIALFTHEMKSYVDTHNLGRSLPRDLVVNNANRPSGESWFKHFRPFNATGQRGFFKSVDKNPSAFTANHVVSLALDNTEGSESCVYAAQSDVKQQPSEYRNAARVGCAR